MSKEWFSSKVRLVCLIETVGSSRYMDCVFLFKSENLDTAFDKALKLGRTLERNYINSDNHQVLWKLKKIISLDWLGDKSLDGVEVYSEPVEIPKDEVTGFSVKFEPEKSVPTQSI